MDTKKLYQLAHNSLLSLSNEDGINASSKEEIFGCIFGRDSALTILKILRAHDKQPSPLLLEISHKALLNLVRLQGQETNIESGEEPGKFIHEFRKDNHEHLSQPQHPNHQPWFTYPDGFLKNYDSLDSTPLTLIALYKYWQATKDDHFLVSALPAVETGLNWIINLGDQDKDFLLEYSLPSQRSHGGLTVHSWTDSHQSMLTSEGLFPKYPIAPIEVQAFAWLALKLWGSFYLSQSPRFSQKLNSFANGLKKAFNNRFIFQNQGFYFGAQALDGDKNLIATITSNPLLCLWACFNEGGQNESIINPTFIPDFVARAFLPDLFVEDCGIRSMSSLSPTFDHNSYHNGSFWPIINGLIVEGLENFNLLTQAQKLKQASLLPLHHFGCPLELYIKTETGYGEYHSSSGQVGYHTQAWTAASLLDLTAN